MSMVTLNSEMPTKLRRVSIYLEPEIKELIDKMANEEHRSVANMVSVLIFEALEDRGVVSKPEKPSDDSSNNYSDNGNSKPDDSGE
ncbi:MAG: ribbon-helix-helix protein, CopG family [Cyanobacteria bacterium J06592_8]